MPNTAEKVRQQLRGTNVKFGEDEKKSAQGSVLLTRFRIPNTVRVDVSLRADYARGRVSVVTKNLLRTGSDDFAFPAGDCSEKLLEDLALTLIGQPSDFHRYRTVLSA